MVDKSTVVVILVVVFALMIYVVCVWLWFQAGKHILREILKE